MQLFLPLERDGLQRLDRLASSYLNLTLNMLHPKYVPHGSKKAGKTNQRREEGKYHGLEPTRIHQ